MAVDLDVADPASAPQESLLEAVIEMADRPAWIDVCVCTFRRRSLATTLASIAAQRDVRFAVRVIVADNDDRPSAVPIVEAARSRGLDVLYVHAPARNISVARNACLAAATGELLAFIDDDEVAQDTWLAGLVAALDTAPGTAAAFGPVRAIYPDGAPGWARTADLHSTRAVRTAAGIDTGYTSNAVVRRAALGGLTFDVSLGRSGGEDTDFFTRLHRLGRRFTDAPEAIVTEEVTADRLTTRWLATRAFRSGQTHARRYLGGAPARVSAALTASAKCAYCLGVTVLNAPSAARWRRSWVRACLHAGAVSRLLGLREGKLYG